MAAAARCCPCRSAWHARDSLVARGAQGMRAHPNRPARRRGAAATTPTCLRAPPREVRRRAEAVQPLPPPPPHPPQPAPPRPPPLPCSGTPFGVPAGDDACSFSVSRSPEWHLVWAAAEPCTWCQFNRPSYAVSRRTSACAQPVFLEVRLDAQTSGSIFAVQVDDLGDRLRLCLLVPKLGHGGLEAKVEVG